MTTIIRITTGPLVVEGELNDSPTAQTVTAALPIKAKANCWGDRDLFSHSREHWPSGQAFFFGPTPASSDERPQAASPANPVGRILGDANQFRAVANGADVILEKA